MSYLREDLSYYRSRFRRWHACALAVLVVLSVLSIFGGTFGVPKALVIAFGTIAPFIFFGVLVTII